MSYVTTTTRRARSDVLGQVIIDDETGRAYDTDWPAIAKETIGLSSNASDAEVEAFLSRPGVSDGTRALFWQLRTWGPDGAAQRVNDVLPTIGPQTTVVAPSGERVDVADLDPASQAAWQAANAQRTTAANTFTQGLERAQQLEAAGVRVPPTAAEQLLEFVKQQGPIEIVDPTTSMPVLFAHDAGALAVTVPPGGPNVSRIPDLIEQFVNVIGQAGSVAQGVSDEAQRVANAIRGGAAGGQAGYSAPVNMTPYLWGGAALLGVAVLPKLLRGR